MTAVSAEDLRLRTLGRQFPAVGGVGAQAVLELFDRLGPIQSQVPRAPFLFVASRLPGATYAMICELFEAHLLLKATNLRGTVHTSGRSTYFCLDAVATPPRRAAIRRSLSLDDAAVAQLDAEVQRFCRDEWRPRADIIAHIRAWLQHAWPDGVARLDTFSESLVWGNSGLIRRPKDAAWEKRTDSFHRTAASVVPDVGETTPAAALVGLVRRHLLSYGPVTRRDLAFFFGVGLRQVDEAVKALGDSLVELTGPGSTRYLDLGEPPTGGSEPGLRLLAEFDGLLLGFEGHNRHRFVDPDGLSKIWGRGNGLFSPVVLHDGRLVATWRTVTERGRTRIHVTMLDGHLLGDDAFTDPVTAVEAALDVQIGDVQVRRWSERGDGVP